MTIAPPPNSNSFPDNPDFITDWNEHAKPLVWTKTARQIKRSIRNAKLISET